MLVVENRFFFFYLVLFRLFGSESTDSNTVVFNSNGLCNANIAYFCQQTANGLVLNAKVAKCV